MSLDNNPIPDPNFIPDPLFQPLLPPTTRWDRLEPSARDEDLEEGLQARIADPLWMLARQWQLGEFRGEDAASPIHARATLDSHPVKSFRNEAEASAPVEAFFGLRPLETRVEAESVLDGPAALGLAAEAGLQFLRRLSHAGLDSIRADVDWQAAFPVDVEALGDTSRLPARTQRKLRTLGRRGVDGRALLVATSAEVQALLVAAGHGDSMPDVAAVYMAWADEYGKRFREPGVSGDCWVDERMEYSFSVGVATDAGEVVLVADEYAGGTLDWPDFRVSAEHSHGLPPAPPSTTTLERLPTPASYRGQPAPRWWEFEDRRVYFGNVAAGPADISRLIVAEFGAVFSDDWYVIPATVGVATLNRVTDLKILDVFGEVHECRSTAVNDAEEHGEDRPWAYFELGGDSSVDDGDAPWLFIPPVLTNSVDSAPVERVTMVRDEMANLGWAIEERIELPTGESMRRRQQWQAQPSSEEDATTEASEAWRYRLQTPVPPWWIPLVPERLEGSEQMTLRRGRMQAWDELEASVAGPKGQLVGQRRALRLNEEAVTRGGLVLGRHWQLTRGRNGAMHLWMARRKRPGRGDRGSGLEFDVIDQG